MQANLQILIAPSACPAKLERIVWLLAKTVRIAMLANTVKAQKTMVLPLPMPLFAWVVPPVGRPKPVVPNANRVKQVLLVMSPVSFVKIAKLVNTVKVRQTTVLTPLIQRLVLIAQRGIHQVLAVPSANHVELERTVLDAKIVLQVNTVTVLIQ